VTAIVENTNEIADERVVAGSKADDCVSMASQVPRFPRAAVTNA
jgi:hypothetical protein